MASQFVVEQLPPWLERAENGFLDSVRMAEEITAVVNAIPQEFDPTTLPIELLHQAALDLKMLFTARVHYSVCVPNRLTQLIERACEVTGQPPGVLSYEEIVEFNPEHQPRGFCSPTKTATHRITVKAGPGDVAAAEERGERPIVGTGENKIPKGHMQITETFLVAPWERAFYSGHMQVERRLAGTINELEWIATTLCASQPNPFSSPSRIAMARRIAEALERVVSDIQLLLPDMRRLGVEMPKEAFASFRRYLTSPPGSNEPGASGAFSPGIWTTNTLLSGPDLAPEILDYGPQNLRYFPTNSRTMLVNAWERAARGESLVDAIRTAGKPAYLVRRYKEATDAMELFLRYHLSAVYLHLGRGVDGEIETGTAGATTDRRLRALITMHHPARASLGIDNAGHEKRQTQASTSTHTLTG